jgi:hypothetical protein
MRSLQRMRNLPFTDWYLVSKPDSTNTNHLELQKVTPEPVALSQNLHYSAF